MLRVTASIVLQPAHLEERFVRASGPGGQNVNKVATSVELRFDVAAAPLPSDLKERLVRLAGSRMTADGLLVIQAREHRTQAQNREAARTRLVELVRAAARRPKPRRKTRPTAASRERRVEAKKRRSTIKQRRAEPGRDD